MNKFNFTPTLILPRQGGGDYPLSSAYSYPLPRGERIMVRGFILVIPILNI
jgi:hypothetical protein